MVVNLIFHGREENLGKKRPQLGQSQGRKNSIWEGWDCPYIPLLFRSFSEPSFPPLLIIPEYKFLHFQSPIVDC